METKQRRIVNPFQKEQGKFSIIIPVYKTEKFLETNLEHIDRQNYTNYEVIVVFDGQNKKGVEIIKKLKKRFPKMDLRYDVIKHGGAPKARNHGAKLATGDFYVFLDCDSYLYPGTLREWANLFELNPHINRVWGLYDLNEQGRPLPLGGGIVTDKKYVPDYWAFRFGNYCSGTNPIRKEAFVGWDESLKSLQDWDMNIRMLKKGNWEGKDWLYVPKPYFITEECRKESISLDAVKNFLEREKIVLEKNDIPISKTCFCSWGAQYHGINLAKICGYDYHHHPQYMPFEYERLIQVGFFTGTNEQVKGTYSLFEDCIDLSKPDKKMGRFPGKKIIMWIGTDIWQMRNNAGFETLKARRETWTKEGWISIVGDKNAHDKLKEIGFDSKIVYYPPHHFYDVMPLPKEPTIGIYEDDYDENFKYHNEHIYSLAKKYPKIKFLFYGAPNRKGMKHEGLDNVEHIGWVDMNELMPRLSMHIELTITGGIGSGGVEYLMAGRQVVTDVDEPYTFKAENTLESIEKAFKRALDKPFDQRKMSEFYKKRHDPKKFKKILDSL
jgi:glycosyltransferase involved in cell wall biosynthesis